jgi:hypothetical protein
MERKHRILSLSTGLLRRRVGLLWVIRERPPGTKSGHVRYARKAKAVFRRRHSGNSGGGQYRFLDGRPFHLTTGHSAGLC